jgi:beta-1,4-mannosyltransferase
MWDLLTCPTLPQLLSAGLLCCAAWLLLSRRSPRKHTLRSVAIVVLGDVGRSPRMMYHAESFAKLHFETFLVGYKGAIPISISSCRPSTARLVLGSKPVPSLLSLPHVHFLYLSQPPPVLRNLPFTVFAPIKIAQQVLTILHALLWRVPHPPEFILVQVSFSRRLLAWSYGLRGRRIRPVSLLYFWYGSWARCGEAKSS